jgi:hypothetical protein
MSAWQGAWQVARFELKSGWSGYILTLIFFSYMALVQAPLLNDLFGEEMSRASLFAVDFVYLVTIPNLGFIMNKTIFKFWKEDPYTKKLMMWRTMPISLDQIVIGRLLQLVITILPIWFFYFLLQYVVTSSIRTQLNVGEYINYALFGLGCSVVFAVTYVFLEQGFPGKVYFVYCLSYIVLYGCIIWLLWTQHISIILSIVNAADHGNWRLTIVALLAAVVMLAAGKAAIHKRLRSRNLSN